MNDEEKTVRARVGAWLGAALSALGVLGVIALAVSDHRHRAVMLMVAVLVGMGALRLWTPGRPWFASRARLMDVAVYVILAAIIWWFAPYVSTARGALNPRKWPLGGGNTLTTALSSSREFCRIYPESWPPLQDFAKFGHAMRDPSSLLSR